MIITEKYTPNRLRESGLYFMSLAFVCNKIFIVESLYLYLLLMPVNSPKWTSAAERMRDRLGYS